MQVRLFFYVYAFSLIESMIYYKTQSEIELMRHSALLVGKAIAEVAKLIKPGVTTGKA